MKTRLGHRLALLLSFACLLYQCFGQVNVGWTLIVDGNTFNRPDWWVREGVRVYNTVGYPEQTTIVVTSLRPKASADNFTPGNYGIVVYNSTDQIIATHIVPNKGEYIPFYYDESSRTLLINYDPGRGNARNEVWKINSDKTITSEPFPIVGSLIGGNLTRTQYANDDGWEVQNALYTKQWQEGAFILRGLSFRGFATQSSISRADDGITLSTDTQAGQSYRVQSSEDLKQWSDEEVIRGDGSTKSVQRPSGKPKEFLRVVEE